MTHQMLEVADQTFINIHIRPMIEHVQRTGDVDFQRCRQRFGFLGQLILKHFRIFLADIVKPVIPVRNDNGLLEAFRAGSQVQERKLQMNAGIEIVQEITLVFHPTNN